MTIREQEQELLRGRLLGRGAALPLIEPDGSDLGRDLMLAPNATGGRDLAFAQGVPCLAQDLSVALTTLRGSDLFNTEFGFDGVRALAEETNPLLVRERVRVAVIRVLQADSRVRRIADVKFEDERLDRPAAGGSRTLRVRVVFETVTGATLALELAGGTLAVSMAAAGVRGGTPHA